MNEELTCTLTNWENVNPVLETWAQRIERNLISIFHILSPCIRKIIPTISSPPVPEWTTTRWKNIMVGDFVLLRNNEVIPADVAIISTSEMDNMCFIETKSMDGETNLKIRRAPDETSWVRSARDAAQLRGVVICDTPNASLYKFQGTFILQERDATGVSKNQGNDVDVSKNSTTSEVGSSSLATSKSLDGLRLLKDSDPSGASSEHFTNDETSDCLRIPLTLSSILLRGCVLRNTEWVVGLVLYTGSDTKIQLNAGSTPSKRTRIEKQMNPQVILNFVILIAMCLVCGITHMLYFSAFNFEDAPFALEPYQGNTGQALIFTVTFLYVFRTFLSKI
jgi:phospholipid-translocating ATPase